MIKKEENQVGRKTAFFIDKGGTIVENAVIKDLRYILREGYKDFDKHLFRDLNYIGVDS